MGGNKPTDARQYFTSYYGLQRRFINNDLIELRRKEVQTYGKEDWYNIPEPEFRKAKTQTKAKCRRQRKKASHRLGHQLNWIRDYMVEAAA
jgi:hypothetical protein